MPSWRHPNGAAVLAPGDLVVAFGPREAPEAMEAWHDGDPGRLSQDAESFAFGGEHLAGQVDRDRRAEAPFAALGQS